MKRFFAITALIVSAHIGTLSSAWADGGVPLKPITKMNVILGEAKTYTTAQIKQAIFEAGTLRQWTITENSDGSLAARLAIRTHILDVKITYDSTSIAVEYLNSVNLDYEKKSDGTQLIHSKYAEWVRTLGADVTRSLIRLP